LHKVKSVGRWELAVVICGLWQDVTAIFLVYWYHNKVFRNQASSSGNFDETYDDNDKRRYDSDKSCSLLVKDIFGNTGSNRLLCDEDPFISNSSRSSESSGNQSY